MGCEVPEEILFLDNLVEEVKSRNKNAKTLWSTSYRDSDCLAFAHWGKAIVNRRSDENQIDFSSKKKTNKMGKQERLLDRKCDQPYDWRKQRKSKLGPETTGPAHHSAIKQKAC